MKAQSTPQLNGRYWVAICAASVAGCNLGDFVSLYLHLGHWMGLFPLLLVLAAVLYAESSSQPSEAWYWGAIIVVRTAATNAADLLTHTLGLDYSWVIAALEAVQVLAVLQVAARANASRPGGAGGLATGGWYWASMMTAGTLGTAAGDCTAEVFKLGTAGGSAVLGALAGCLIAAGFARRWQTQANYWLPIIAVRAAGTTSGDWLAFPDGGGLGLGLPLSTGISCAVLMAILLIWKPSAAKLVAGASEA